MLVIWQQFVNLHKSFDFAAHRFFMNLGCCHQAANRPVIYLILSIFFLRIGITVVSFKWLVNYPDAMDVSNGKVVSRTRACLFSSILSGVLFARFYLWNTGLITEFSKSVLPFRSPSPTLSPRKSFGSFSSSLFYLQNGHHRDLVTGLVTGLVTDLETGLTAPKARLVFLTCLVFKTVLFFLLHC